MRGHTVLLIEDNEDVRELICRVLERSGYRAIEAADGRDGLRKFFEGRPDLVILDIDLPELDGWEVLERIRELSDVPVCMLTASDGELDKVRGLRGGADDYLTKPFGHQEMLARTEALLRRAAKRAGDGETEVLVDDTAEIDFAQRRARVGGRELELTPTEFKLLGVFARHPRQVLGHDQLLEMVWGDGQTGSSDQVKLYVSYLRRKLRDAGAEPIRTVRGFGYRYDPD